MSSPFSGGSFEKADRHGSSPVLRSTTRTIGPLQRMRWAAGRRESNPDARSGIRVLMTRQPSERTVIFLIGAIQFVNILDFMMVLPLGPFFAGPLGILASWIGVIGGSYTAAAALSGIACSFFLDRFDRRKALGVAVAGLVVATALGGLSTGFGTIVFARILAGTFGGPATSLSLSIVADVIPPDRRGKALGAVMGSFSIAAVLGVPTGLELALWGGWRLPFFSVAGLGLLLLPAAIALLPPLTRHPVPRDRSGERRVWE